MYLSYEQMPAHSRVWVYQSNRAFGAEELAYIEKTLRDFTENWMAHGVPLETSFKIVYNRFIVLLANESRHAPSGCSIDTSVHTMKELEKQFGVSLMDRMSIAYRTDTAIEYCSMSAFKKQLQSGVLNGDTVVFNNMVENKEAFEMSWEVPVSESWHQRMLPADQMSS